MAGPTCLSCRGLTLSAHLHLWQGSGVLSQMRAIANSKPSSAQTSRMYRLVLKPTLKEARCPPHVQAVPLLTSESLTCRGLVLHKATRRSTALFISLHCAQRRPCDLHPQVSGARAVASKFVAATLDATRRLMGEESGHIITHICT